MQEKEGTGQRKISKNEKPAKNANRLKESRKLVKCVLANIIKSEKLFSHETKISAEGLIQDSDTTAGRC